ncbi:MAG: caspase family protein [Chlamydiales bacterium]|nr:caspase family protein [Chlamydiales bacterium]
MLAPVQNDSLSLDEILKVEDHNLLPERKSKTKRVAIKTLNESSALATATPTRGAALLIGINYLKTPESRLDGCINDVKKVETVLKKQFQFQAKNIKMLRDDSPDKSLRPTRENILKELKALVNKAEKEKLTHIRLHYSGHGSYMQELAPLSGDEKDGRDEAICPSDYKKSGIIKDDELKSIFVDKLPEGLKATVVMDCCHSGTIMDLKHTYKVKDRQSLAEKESFFNRLLLWLGLKTEPQAKVVCLSGCKDEQVSMSAYNLDRQREWQGAMTWSLLKALKENNYSISNHNLVDRMRNILAQAKMKQLPQLTSSREIPADEPFFV